MRLQALTIVALVTTARTVAGQSPTPTFLHSVQAIARRQAVDDSVADPRARSILLTNGAPTPRAFVLLHGMTDSPKQFEPLARRLHADGYNVYVPRLPRHGVRGGTIAMLVPLTADELRAAGDSIVTEASGLGDSVIVLGLSMGGTVSAWVAQYRVVRRVVLVAPAIEPGRIPAIIDRPIIGLATHIPNVTRGDVPDTTRPDRELGFSSRAAAEVLELGTSVLREARHMSPRTTQMTLLVNANDRTINSRTAKTLAQRWAGHGASVSVFEFPDSLRLPHNILDPPHGSTSGTVILDLLRDLAYGARPSSLATQVLLRK